MTGNDDNKTDEVSIAQAQTHATAARESAIKAEKAANATAKQANALASIASSMAALTSLAVGAVASDAGVDLYKGEQT